MNPQPGDTLTSFSAYFRQLAQQHLGLAGSFVHGSAERILNASRSDLTYPCLWLETPTLHLTEKDGTAPDGQRRAAFVILQAAPPSDYDAQDAAWELTERIALDVLSRMRRDRQQRLFRFSLHEHALEPVATLSGAGEIGWRFEFELGHPFPIVYDPARWAAPTP